ncbi:pentapeptide repeat-containing protein [Lactiplantibacillus plantarum]|uniref:pentapeptide repeat-containing protein n=3 Tax=Lactiplantibacillus TaxID=2767842 RepID=UPI001EE8ED32|nr:pentapeptide repeat-containing protein [Lactiplantibacillus plantarum]
MNNRLTTVKFNETNLDQVAFNDTALKNIDLSTCQFERLELDTAAARGMIVNIDQAAYLAAVLNGIKVKP